MSPFAWHDYSDFVVHFTKDAFDRTAYDNIISICYSRCLRAMNPFGVGKAAPQTYGQQTVCFSEIPLHELARLVNRRGPYGIGFTKDFITSHGGCPVWYAPKDGPQASSIKRLMEIANFQPTEDREQIWALTPFIDFPGHYPAGPYKFEWEREWRLKGDLLFNEKDVAFLTIPEQFHSAVRHFFEQAIAFGTGPGYMCPYVDPTWSWERIQAAFATTPSH